MISPGQLWRQILPPPSWCYTYKNGCETIVFICLKSSVKMIAFLGKCVSGHSSVESNWHLVLVPSSSNSWKKPTLFISIHSFLKTCLTKLCEVTFSYQAPSLPCFYVTLCHKSEYPLPPLGCDVTLERPLTSCQVSEKSLERFPRSIRD